MINSIILIVLLLVLFGAFILSVKMGIKTEIQKTINEMVQPLINDTIIALNAAVESMNKNKAEVFDILKESKKAMEQSIKNLEHIKILNDGIPEQNTP